MICHRNSLEWRYGWENAVIKISVFYPHSSGASFDLDYYVGKHMPMVRNLLGPACKRADVECGLSGAAAGSAPTYIAMGHLYFESVKAFQEVWAPNAAQIVADIPNYTA